MTRKVYTFGDSHALHAWCKIPRVVASSGGAMTMYSFGKGKPVIKHQFVPGSIVCFCYGEIDCRCHVNKYQPWKDTVESLVQSYLGTLSLNETPENEIWIYNVLPPPRKESAMDSEGAPFIGSNEERLAYAKYMNDLFRRSKYKVVDVYEKYSDPEGYLRMEMSDSHVHIEDPIFLLKWLEENP